MSYRAGYTPDERRAIEQGLFDGKLIGVTATNALELGVDVGGLDATVLTGYPGTIASAWQQAGRAGRGSDEALSIFIALDNPLDQVADVSGVRDVVLTRQRHLDRRDPLRLEAGLHLVEAGRGALVAVDEQYGADRLIGLINNQPPSTSIADIASQIRQAVLKWQQKDERDQGPASPNCRPQPGAYDQQDYQPQRSEDQVLAGGINGRNNQQRNGQEH